MQCENSEREHEMDPISQFIVTLLNNILGGLSGPLQPLINLTGNTPLEFSTANPIVDTSWQLMVGAADSFLGLIVIVGAIQVMYGQSTGTLYMPLGQFLSRAVLTVILIHLSFIMGQDLIILNNELCGLFHVQVQDFIRQVNGGQLFNAGQALNLTAVLAVVFSASLARVALQAVKRVVFFNVLFVLSGPAFLLSFHPLTSAWFAYWGRTYVVTAFTQFVQFTTMSLGFQFLLASKQTGTTGFLLAIAMLNLTAEIPALLSRFATSAGASAPGVGSFVRSAITAAALFV
jgi:hypothetical protein